MALASAALVAIAVAAAVGPQATPPPDPLEAGGVEEIEEISACSSLRPLSGGA